MATTQGSTWYFGKIFLGVTATMAAGGAIDALTKPFEDRSLAGGVTAVVVYFGAALIVSLVWYGWLARPNQR